MQKATLVYDEQCSLCAELVRQVSSRTLPEELESVPCHSEEFAHRFPQISQAACEEAMQLVLPDGTVYAGEAAIPHILSRMRGWHWAARAFDIPGGAFISAPLYHWVARHRYALSAMVAPHHGASKCTDPACCHAQDDEDPNN